MNPNADQWYTYKIVAEDGRALYSQRRWGDIEQVRFRQKCRKASFDMAFGESLRKLRGWGDEAQ